MDQFLLCAIVFGSAFTLAVAGFGAGLVAMPLLSWLLGVQMAAPLVALYGILLNLIVLWRYRVSFNGQAIIRLIVSSTVGIPLGVWALSRVKETYILKVLGLVLIGYSLYMVVTPRLPKLNPDSGWAYGFGFVSGCLGGAYNAFGPPVIIYSDLSGWLRNEFKSNLQGFFLFSGIIVTLVHALSGNLTWLIWQDCLLAVPAGVLGLIAGLSLDRFIDQQKFRRVVLILLLVLGLGLLI